MLRMAGVSKDGRESVHCIHPSRRAQERAPQDEASIRLTVLCAASRKLILRVPAAGSPTRVAERLGWPPAHPCSRIHRMAWGNCGDVDSGALSTPRYPVDPRL
jgi:hypothetical protein